jgi:hypothetical protein
MALRTTYSSETWEKVYQAFSAVNFTAFDFNTVKQSLIDYTRTYYPEQFNDYIQSSEFIALLEVFAYICEQLAYRIDMVGHENFITTAQRKQSILKLAKLISYKATRNIPVRGLVKLTTVNTTEQVIDSRGINLSGLTIVWNDPNNPNWREQFLLVMNRALNSRFGEPQKSFQVGDVVMDLYSLKNSSASFPVGVFPYSVSTGTDTYPMEVVPVDIDENGPFEREPDPVAALSVIYANDGIGDGSDFTGFLAFTKQGILSRTDYVIPDLLPNRRLEFNTPGVNHTDVWVQRIDDLDRIIERWTQVDSVSEQNLAFNDLRSTRKKFEVDTLEGDRIRVSFGDGDFSDIPQGTFRFWSRQSIGRSIVIQKNRINNQPLSFSYTGAAGNAETCTFTFSLTTTLQNGSAAESIEHIRRSAPATYYAQNRMVNGQDYNTYMLKDPTILRLSAINRTFAGQPKYIDWNDASGKYENVKLFGDDLTMRYTISLNSQTTSVSGRALIDTVIEPLLGSPGLINMMLHLSASDPVTRGVVSPPRRRFIEDNRGDRYFDRGGAYVNLNSSVAANGSLKEKTAIQGVIDSRFYGEPLSIVVRPDGAVWGVIPDPDLNPEDDSNLYQENLPRTIDGQNLFRPGDTGSGPQGVGQQEYFALRYNRYMRGVGTGSITFPDGSTLPSALRALGQEVLTIEVQSDGSTLSVRSNLRGTFPAGRVDEPYQFTAGLPAPAFNLFEVTSSPTSPLQPGDAFIVDISAGGAISLRSLTAFVPGLTQPINLNGWWQLLFGTSELPDYGGGIVDSQFFDQKFTTADTPANQRQHSWLIFVKKIRNASSNIIGYEVHSRDLKLVVESPTTKFWYNSVDQLLDSDTKKRVFDNIKVLRSNLDFTGAPLRRSQVYDVVGSVSSSDGVTNFNTLEIMPSDLLNEDDSGNLIPDRLLQFENFAGSGGVDASYEYFVVGASDVVLQTTDPEIGNAIGAFEAAPPGALAAFNSSTSTWYGRRLRMPRLEVDGDPGLDFMWSHFSPFTNIIDPSVTNIHDIYLMTRGYYDNVISYVRGANPTAPTPPSPLELRSSYGYLLDNKMLSDTVVLHPGRIKLLFGSLADPELRAKFKVVRQQGASLTNERIKQEILSVINTYFDIDNWDFGGTFYATELITLIHQRLPADVASVVLVPVYSTNSFGSLFTVESGHDEILQSAAQLSDIEVVDALTPAVIRQSK